METKSVYERMTQAEREVAEELKKLGIHWSFEHPIFVWDDNKRPRVWAPDFYLKEFGIYVEVCGSEDFNYSYRRKILDKNGIRVIFLHLYKNKEKWKYHLVNYLEKCAFYRFKKLNKILNSKN